jgi:hypothetical protein
LVGDRDPVSHRLGFGPNLPVFMFNALYFYRDRIRYIEEIDTIAVAEVLGDTLKIIDLVAPALPPAESVIPFLREDARSVEFLFTPDRTGYETAPRPLAADEFPMVRGAFPVEGEPLMFPYTAHF